MAVGAALGVETVNGDVSLTVAKGTCSDASWASRRSLLRLSGVTA
jgi:hypothetical protein